jgi:asparagine synthase (glutamine-hydrolysing)
MLKMFFGFKLDDIDNPFYSHQLRWNNSNHITKHLSDKLKEEIGTYSPLSEITDRLPENYNTWDPVAKAQWLETTVFMSGYLLSSQGDRMALANSVEGRYPFLDYRLIEFCATLPSRYKLNGLNEKHLLKKLMKGRIPESIAIRSKQAYRAPVKSVFLSNNPPEYVNKMLSDQYIKKVGVFNPESVHAVLSRITKNGNSTEVDNMLLTFVISTHLLFDLFIDNNNSRFKPAKLTNLLLIDDL